MGFFEKFKLEKKKETDENALNSDYEISEDFESCEQDYEEEASPENAEDLSFEECTMDEDLQNLSDYMAENNYGMEDYEEYSKNPEWQELHEKAYGETVLDKDAARDQLIRYMSEHNYGREDYAEYSQDPEWQKLNKAVYG